MTLWERLRAYAAVLDGPATEHDRAVLGLIIAAELRAIAERGEEGEARLLEVLR